MTHAVQWIALARRTGILESVPLFTRLQVSMLVSRRPVGVGRNLAGAWFTRRNRFGKRYRSVPSPDARSKLGPAVPWVCAGERHRSPRHRRAILLCRISSYTLKISKSSELSKSSRHACACRAGAKKNPGQATCLPGFFPWRACGLFEFRKPPGQCLERLTS